MAKQQSDPHEPERRRGLRTIHAVIAWLSIGIGLPLALIGGTAATREWIAQPGLRLGLAVIVLLLVPLLIADRLLPRDSEQRRPGLVRDVLAFCWVGTALVVTVLAASLTGPLLRDEARELEDRGWNRAAFLSRWMAGPAPVEDATPLEPAPIIEAPAAETLPAPTLAGSELTLAAASSPAPTPETIPSPEPATTEPTPEAEPETVREYSPAELFSSYAPAVVSIKIGHGGFHSGGTGFFIDDAGTIATNEHVIDDARDVRVKLWDGTEIERVELLVADPEVDLALLRVDPNALKQRPTPTVLGDSEAVQVGEPVSVIGNPLGLDHTLTNGIVSARRVYEGERYIQMSAPISPGNSGGPVFDRHGRVIGVSVAQMIGGQNLNLAVPVAQLRELIADEYPNRRSFGASSW